MAARGRPAQHPLVLRRARGRLQQWREDPDRVHNRLLRPRGNGACGNHQRHHGRGRPDLTVSTVEHRYGSADNLPEPIRWLGDNGICYTARYTRAVARDINLLPLENPVPSPQSNGLAEAFVRKLNREYVRLNPTVRTYRHRAAAKLARPSQKFASAPRLRLSLPGEHIAQIREAPPSPTRQQHVRSARCGVSQCVEGAETDAGGGGSRWQRRLCGASSAEGESLVSVRRELLGATVVQGTVRLTVTSPGWNAGSREASQQVDVTVVILTYNEARHIARAIASVASFARAVLVIDSFSTDDTVAIAESAGARVLKNKFVNYSKQFQWGLDEGGIQTAWVLRLDADEIIEPDLAREISERLPAMPADIVGINFSRKHIFLDRWVRHGGRYPLVLLRLWRMGHGRIEDRWMDEHIVVWGGRTIDFKGGFADHNLNDLTFFIDKHNKYAVREAIDVLTTRYGLLKQDRALKADTASRQASIKRLFKEKLYNRLPLAVGPSLYFLFRVILQRGILDGKSGMIYHVLQGFWYRFLVNAKIYEYERSLADCSTNDERLARLSQLTGFKLGTSTRTKPLWVGSSQGLSMEQSIDAGQC